MAAMFRRKGAEDQVEATDDQSSGGAVDEETAVVVGFDRSAGPWDISEYEASEEIAGITRLDLTGMLMPGVDGMQLQMQQETPDGPIMAVTAILEDSAMQVQPFAAPRSGGYWDEVRAEIIENLAGNCKEVAGNFGVEVHAMVPAMNEEGREIMQPARFIGIDGPRWFLRAVMLGRAAVEPEAGLTLEGILRDVVVRRGEHAQAPGEPIPLGLPTELPEGVDPQAQGAEPARQLPDPFERGPEITEIR